MVNFASSVAYTTTRKIQMGSSLVVQWLGLGAFTARAQVRIPGQGTETPTSCAAWPKKKRKKEKLETERRVKDDAKEPDPGQWENRWTEVVTNWRDAGFAFLAGVCVCVCVGREGAW